MQRLPEFNSTIKSQLTITRRKVSIYITTKIKLLLEDTIQMSLIK